MKRLRKFRLKYLFTGVLTAVLFFTQTWKTAGNYFNYKEFDVTLTTFLDTVPAVSKKDSLVKMPARTDSTINIPADSLIRNNLENDTTGKIIKTDTFSLKIAKDSIDAPVRYQAEDSAVILIQAKRVILYGKTKTTYKDIELTAPQTELVQESQILTAINKLDSVGNPVERAHFKQGENTFYSDTIRYNFKTQKGLTKNTHTMQGELHFQGDNVKRIGDIIYSRKGVITTCNLDEPHFGFRYDKIKLVNNKVAVTGPIHPEFENVPVPIYLPFGFFPLKQGRHSGILPPQFTMNDDFGLGLENFGYYKVLNDYFDVTVRGSFYSYGGWTFNFVPTYRKIYRYQGQFSFGYQHTKFNFKGDPDYSLTKSFQINWSHQVDSRARPGTTFSASVQAGSTKYNENIPNNAYRNFQNQMNSSIAYGKTWAGKPFNLTISANHNQNNATRLINLNLPDVGFTMNTIYPFQRKEILGSPKWYEKLGVAYNGSLRSQVSFYDTAFQFKQLIDTLQWGGQHNYPITLSLPPILGGAIMVAPGFSYESKWIAQKVRKTWNNTLNKLDTNITKGFFTDHKIGFGLGFNTALFGTFNFKGSRLMAIRHIIRPSLSLNYSPSLSKSHFYRTQIDKLGNTYEFSEFEGSLFGFYGNQDFGGMGFTLDNNLEMKTRSKKDTGQEAIKKIRLIDGFGFSTGYNFIADSFKLSPFNFYLRSTLFEKINITAGANMTPYQTDSRGYPVDKYYWEGGKFKLGRITSGSLSISSNFSSKPKDQKKADEKKKRQDELLNQPGLAADRERLMDYMSRNPGDFVDFNVPWTLGFGFSVSFTERLKPDYSGFDKVFSSNMNFNGSLNITPKWNMAVNGYYDFTTSKLQMFTMNLSREMHCWQMSISVTPVGLYRYFSVSVNPKSGLLRDLKVNRTRYFSSY